MKHMVKHILKHILNTCQTHIKHTLYILQTHIKPIDFQPLCVLTFNPCAFSSNSARLCPAKCCLLLIPSAPSPTTANPSTAQLQTPLLTQVKLIESYCEPRSIDHLCKPSSSPGIRVGWRCFQPPKSDQVLWSCGFEAMGAGFAIPLFP